MAGKPSVGSSRSSSLSSGSCLIQTFLKIANRKTKIKGDVLVATSVVLSVSPTLCKKMFLSFVTSHLTVSPRCGLLSKEEG